MTNHTNSANDLLVTVTANNVFVMTAPLGIVVRAFDAHESAATRVAHELEKAPTSELFFNGRVSFLGFNVKSVVISKA